jgi:hypothetical protein
MPRQARLDAPGALHHVIGRALEKTQIFRSRRDREDFLDRLGKLSETGAFSVYAWALMDTHISFLADRESIRFAKHAAVARYLGVTTSLVNYYASSLEKKH